MCCISETIHPNKRLPVTPMPVQIESLLPLAKAVDTTTSTTRHRRQRPARRVSFQQSEIVSDAAVGSSLTEEERNELWYHPNELVAFKNEARVLSRQLRTNSVPDKECARGLEHRISMDRQKNKCLALRAIVRAQDSHHPEQLARIASRCTAWAKEVALLTGHSDYYAAYEPSLAHLVPTTPHIQQPVRELKRKRQRVEVIVVDSDEENLRRTRPRMSVQQSDRLRQQRQWGYVTVP